MKLNIDSFYGPRVGSETEIHLVPKDRFLGPEFPYKKEKLSPHPSLPFPFLSLLFPPENMLWEERGQVPRFWVGKRKKQGIGWGQDICMRLSAATLMWPKEGWEEVACGEREDGVVKTHE